MKIYIKVEDKKEHFIEYKYYECVKVPSNYF